MDLVFILLPFCLLLAGVGVGFFIWAVKSGQFDDTTTPAIRILFDDETAAPHENGDERKQDG